MNSGKTTRAVVEAGILTGVAVVLMLISLYIPFISLVTLFVWPLPFTLIYIRHDIKYSILGLIVCAIVTAMFSDPLTSMYFTLIFGVMSIVMGYCIKSDKSVTLTLLYMGITNFVCIIAVFYMFNSLMGQDLIGQFKTMLEASTKTVTSMYSDLGVPRETIDKFLKLFDVNNFIKLIPGTMVAFSAITSFITYNLGKVIFRRLGYKLKEQVPFSEWYMPFKVAMGMMLFIVVGYILKLRQLNIGENLLINSMVVFRLAFMIIGLSSITFFLKKKKVARGAIIALVVFIALSPLASIVEFVGMIDYAVDLRKLDKNRYKFNRPQ